VRALRAVAIALALARGDLEPAEMKSLEVARQTKLREIRIHLGSKC